MERYQKENKEYKNIISKLTGQVGVDKKFLIQTIQNLRKRKTNQNVLIAQLGLVLYSILNDNGLNENDLINRDRLLDKVDAFVYEEKYDFALEVLEVLDCLEPCNQYDNNGKKLYNFLNPIEATILQKRLLSKNIEVLYLISLRTLYLVKKAEIYIATKNVKYYKSTINEILKINPVNFNALILKANLFYKVGSSLLKRALLDSYNVAYMPSQLTIYLNEMSKFYLDQKNYSVAYCCLMPITLYEDYSLIENNLKYIEKEANKDSISKFIIPSLDEAKRVLARNEIPYTLKIENIELIKTCHTYELNKSKPNAKILEFYESLLLNISSKSKTTVNKIKRKIKGESKK